MIIAPLKKPKSSTLITESFEKSLKKQLLSVNAADVYHAISSHFYKARVHPTCLKFLALKIGLEWS